MAIDWTKVEIDCFYELYKITYLTQAWYYTSADHSITYDGHVYLPAAIQRGDIVKESELNNVQLDITFPIADFARRYVVTSPVYSTLVTIYLYQDNANVFMAYEGEITKISLSGGNTCSITLKEHTELDIKLPRILIQPACNHILFDSNCSLVKNTWKVPAVVDTIGDLEITCAILASYADGYFTQGIAEFDGDLRFILGHWGGRITFYYPFIDLEVGDTVNVFPGCDKSPSTCKNKFNNLAHYLGCPYVPRKNPVLFGI